MKSPYAGLIAVALEDTPVADVPPEHVEALMRDLHGTLDHLSREEFFAEARQSAAIAKEIPDAAAALADSMGLTS